MMSEWKEYKLEELGTLQRGRSRHRPRYAFHLYGGKYPFIQTGEIREARKFISTYEKTYSEEGLKQSKLWPKGTLCITIAANIAELAILSLDACFPDSVLGFVPDEKKTDLDYIYYTLTHFQKELKHIGEGSVQDNINLGTFQDISFPVPRLSEQRAIASVLSSLDDKIDLLHRQNQTLEQMAEALFRQWFVERCPELAEGEADEGWKDFGLLEVVKLVPGGTPKTSIKKYWDGDIKWISVKEISENYKGFIFNSYKTITEDGLNNSAANLLPKYGTIISARGTVGKIGLLGEEMAFSQSNFGVLHISGRLYFFTFLLLQHIVEELKASAYGSVFDTITTKSFQDIKVTLPDDGIIESFESEILPLFKKMFNNQTQIRTLTHLRDTLLPKLMSGEVRVKND